VKWLENLSLRQKLMLVSTAPAAIALIFLLASNIFVEREIYRDLLHKEMLGSASMLAFNSAALLEFDEKLAGVKLLEATRVYPDIDYACIFDRDGRLFSEYFGSGRPFADRPSAPGELGIAFEPDGAHLYHPIYLGEERLGTIFLHSNLDSYYDRVRREILTVLVLLLFSGVIAVLFAFPIQRLIYNPVTQLAGAARTISKTNDYSLRVIKQGNDELGDLVDQFNHMLRRIQEQSSALKYENQVREGTEQQLTAANEELQFEIGQRIQAEGQLGVLLDDLEKKNAELQDFAYVVSHDLKAPLRGISSLATWLIKDYGDKLDEKGIKYLNQLKDRTRRMHTFIEGILQYSRLGRVQMNRQLLDTQQLVEQVIETLNPPPGFEVRIPEPLPDVYYDKLLLLQIFQNLIGNALQHMGKDEGVITVGCQRRDHHWEFSVSDNGVGIEERHHERIFRIFQSLNPDGDGDSSGIGLTLVKKIVERNGGEIQVKSAPGEGTAFTFTAPILAGADMESRALSIFILDANEDYAKHTARLLGNLGHRVRTAATWNKAKSILAQSQVEPDIILIDDTAMGEEAEAALREIFHAFPETDVIACIPESRGDGPGLRAHGRVAGTIIKPFTLDKLNAILGAKVLQSNEGAQTP